MPFGVTSPRSAFPIFPCEVFTKVKKTKIAEKRR